MDTDRRMFLGLTGLGLLGLATGCAGPASADTAPDDTDTDTDTDADTNADTDCAVTDGDIEGPFYEPGVPVREDLDLYGDDGVSLVLEGVVRDGACAPIANAVVDLWQADPDGAYDDSAAMKYRGQVATDAEGRYRFKTLVPGRYLNGAQYRPAHLHVKVFTGGVARLTTQLYFEGDPYNEGDPWFSEDRMLRPTQDDGTLRASFDLVVT